MNSPENHFLEEAFHANAIKMPHKRIVEILQIHQIQRDMCPISEWCSKVEVLVLVNYSSNEMKIEGSQPHATVDVYAKLL